MARRDGVADGVAGGRARPTTADAVAERLRDAGYAPFRLDGDVLRAGLNEDLGFDAAGRRESVPPRIRGGADARRRRADAVQIASLISPYGEDRARARRMHEDVGLLFLEVFLDTPLSVCEDRDPRHLYDRARRGEIAGVTGVDDPYERPEAADLVIRPGPQTVAEAADAVTEALLRARPRRGTAAYPNCSSSTLIARGGARITSSPAISSRAAAKRDSSTGWTTITKRA